LEVLLKLLGSTLVLEDALVELSPVATIALLSLVVVDNEVRVLVADVLLPAAGVLLAHDDAGWNLTLPH